MLLQFSVTNYKSVRDRTTLDLQAEPRLNDLPQQLVRTTDGKHTAVSSLIVYGRNAAGKSKLLEAFQALANLVETSDKNKHKEAIQQYHPFKFNTTHRHLPTDMEIAFVIQNTRYRYKISYNATEILSETLWFYPQNSSALLYHREKGKNMKFGLYYKGEKRNIEQNLLPNQLFLSKSQSYNVEILQPVYSFCKSIGVILFNEKEYNELYTALSHNLISQLDIENDIKKILKAADTNILDIKITEESSLGSKLMRAFGDETEKDTTTDKILTFHNVYSNQELKGVEQLFLSEESEGTKKLYFLTLIAVIALKNGVTLFIDELDKSLHPLLTRMIINLFHNPKNNPYGAQLIFTTHDSSLLDNMLFRRDQICFVEKNHEGATETYRLSDIKGVRNNIPYDKWYLSGRFGATPVLDDVQLTFEPIA